MNDFIILLSFRYNLARSFGTTNEAVIAKVDRFVGKTYAVGENAITKAYGVYMEDVEGNKLLDFHSGYGAVNQGHGNEKILRALYHQSHRLAMCSRAFHTDVCSTYAEYIHQLFGYDKMIPMNSGTEACETAVKVARKWGYTVKKVEKNKAEVITANNCFWGRTIAAISGCDDPIRYEGFEPKAPGFSMVPFNDPDALEAKLKSNPNIVGFMVEPIQGEAGIIVPDEGYYKKVQDICHKYNVLFITDEIQCGLGRSGDLLCHYHEEKVRPDIVILGKALSNGVLPVSLVLADSNIID